MARILPSHIFENYQRAFPESTLTYHDWLDRKWAQYFSYRNMPVPPDTRPNEYNNYLSDFLWWLNGPSSRKADLIG